MNTLYAAFSGTNRDVPGSVNAVRNPLHCPGRLNPRPKGASLKTGRTVPMESLLERLVAQLLELLDAVLWYGTQPMSLVLLPGPDMRPTKYTPDLLVIWKEFPPRPAPWPWIIEVKPAEFARRPVLREKFKAAAFEAAKRSHHFVVITDEHVASIDMSAVRAALAARQRHHVEFLGDASKPPAPPVDPALVQSILEMLARALDESPAIEALFEQGKPVDPRREDPWKVTYTHTGRRRSLLRRAGSHQRRTGGLS